MNYFIRSKANFKIIKMKNLIPFIVTVFLIAYQAQAQHQELELPSIISDHMVLQQGTTCAIWGWTDANTSVTVSIQNNEVSAKADADGKWALKLPELKAGGPYEMTITADTNIKTIKDILVGENWIGSGQSNMEWQMAWTKNRETEIAKANYPNIRLFTVARAIAGTPQKNVEGKWIVCTPENVEKFSAVLYHFGKNIHLNQQVPIGLIHSSWGGTPAETWVSKERLDQMLEINFLKNSLAKSTKEFDRDIAVFKQKVAETANKENAITNVSDILGMYDIISGKIGGIYSTVLTVEEKDGKLIAFTNWNKNSRKVAFEDGELRFSFDLPNFAEGEFQIKGKFFDGVLRGHMLGNNSDNPVNGIKRKNVKKGLVLAKTAQQNNPSYLFNAMIAPLIPYTIKGVIWYQGEANVTRADKYTKLFSNLITDWRTRWGQGDFPFYYVQLAPFAYNNDPDAINSALLRESQLQTLQTKNTGMAVITDIGNVNDIHPRNKIDVGQRLALWALAKDYGQEDLVFSGPIYKSMKIEGNIIRLDFDHVGSGLMAKNGDLTHFTIAGEDKLFIVADAKIEGNSIVVSSPKINNPVAVRFGFTNGAEPNLFNKEALPASTFRTDNW
jgi:sialate O-acetylesterase